MKTSELLFSLPSKYSEMDLENKLATNITRFLLELGKGFAYVLLCKDKDSSVVEWSLRGITTPLGVASYQLQEVYERTLLEMTQQG